MLEPCSNVDCDRRATETAYVLTCDLEIAVRVCARCAYVIGVDRRRRRATPPLALLPPPEPQRHLEPVRG